MKTNVKGLTDEEALLSLQRHGQNVLTERKSTPFFKKLLDNFGDPIIKILLIALLVTLILPGESGSAFETVGIAATVLIWTLMSRGIV